MKEHLWSARGGPSCLLLVLIVLVPALWFVAMSALAGGPATIRTSAPSAPASTVRLQPAPGQSAVQMFARLRDAGSAAATFPGGTTCTRLGGPYAVTDQGVAMEVYHLNCAGIIGYVNARWVR